MNRVIGDLPVSQSHGHRDY